MPYSLAELEERRNAIARRIAELGDLRAGSISNTSGRCGKPNCRCHRPGQPGHGPQGRTRGCGVPQFPATQPGIYRDQRQDLPPAADRGRVRNGAGKKTAEAIRQEVAREVDQLLRVIFQGRRKTGRFDLEAMEMAVRSAMHRAGAAALSELLEFPAPSDAQRTVACPCGELARYRELRCKVVLTAVGLVQVLRPYYYAHAVTPAHFLSMSIWIWRGQNSLPGCAACRPWWEALVR